MSLYEFTQSRILSVAGTSFSQAGYGERRDLQRLLREQIDIVAPACMVIAEEFGNWEDSRRRIDLLCIDDAANLVVVELKRTEDGGHMDLQAVRYAAMISKLTASQLVEAHAAFRSAMGVTGDRQGARDAIESFLGNELDDASFRPSVRIILAGADFSREITTTALWLNEQGLSVSCVRLQPYHLDGRLLVHRQQVIPLPQAEQFQVRPVSIPADSTTERPSVLTMDEVLARLKARSAVELETALKIHRWLVESADEVFTTSEGFASSFIRDGDPYYPFKVTVGGDVRMWFHYLKRYKRLSSDESRDQLRRRLNEIPGFDIPADRIGGKPKVPLEVLASPEALNRFRAAIEEALGPRD